MSLGYRLLLEQDKSKFVARGGILQGYLTAQGDDKTYSVLNQTSPVMLSLVAKSSGAEKESFIKLRKTITDIDLVWYGVVRQVVIRKD